MVSRRTNYGERNEPAPDRGGKLQSGGHKVTFRHWVRNSNMIISRPEVQSINFQLMVGTVTLEIGQNVPLNVEEELRLDLELAQTLLLQTEELTVLDLGQAVKTENAMLRDVQVGNSNMIISRPYGHHFMR